jgi:hypothetical protein
MFLLHRRSAVILLITLALVHVDAATLSPQSADVFADKIAAIRDLGEQGGRGGAQRTRLTEDEVNSWFLYRKDRWQKVLPSGVAQPQVTIVGEGQVAAKALVDLDAVSKRRAGRGGAFDPLTLIGGTVPVSVAGLLHTKEGKARFEVQSAEISGIPVPVTVLQELVSYYSRTSERPEGVRLDEAFALPSGIRQIEIGRGQAVVVQ